MPKKALYQPIESVPPTPAIVRKRVTALTTATPIRLFVRIVIKKTII